MKFLSQYNQSLGRELNPVSPNHKSRTLGTDSQLPLINRTELKKLCSQYFEKGDFEHFKMNARHLSKP